MIELLIILGKVVLVLLCMLPFAVIAQLTPGQVLRVKPDAEHFELFTPPYLMPEDTTTCIMSFTRAANSIAIINDSINRRVKYSDSTIKYVTPKQLRDSGYLKAVALTAGLIASTLGYTPANASSVVSSARLINTTAPLAGGGDLSADRTLTIANAASNNSTKGAATFDSSYFNDNGSGLIQFGVNYGTGTVSASAVTVNQPRGKITYNSPSILAAGVASFTFTNSYINATSTINIGINGNGANLTSVNCYIKSQTAGSCVVNVQNLSLLSLFNTNMIVDFLVVN